MTKNIIFIIICIAFVACNQEEQKKLKKVEGLESVLEGTQEVLYQVDTARAFQYRRNLMKDVQTVQAHIDTIGKEKAVYISNYNSLSKAFNRFRKKYPEFQKEIAFSEKQLENLKTDIKNDKIPEGKFSEYYQSEMDAIVQLNSSVERSVNGLKVVLDKYEEMRPEVLEFIKKLDTTKVEQ